MRILCFLMQGERSVCDLAACLNLPQNLVSHHLSVLRGLGLVTARRDVHDARLIYYSVDRAALAQLNALYLSFFAANRTRPWQLGCCAGDECCLERESQSALRRTGAERYAPAVLQRPLRADRPGRPAT